MRAGPKAEGTNPISCHPGGWSATWVRGATTAVELEGASTASAPTLGARCKKCCGKKEPPLWTIGEGLYWAVALGHNSPGAGEQGDKGSLRGRRGEERFYS